MSTIRDQISSALGHFAAAWKQNSGTTLGSFFVDTGTLINPFGQRADGRAAVAAMYSEYFQGLLRGTSSEIKEVHVRLVEPDHAFVDAEQAIVGTDGAIVMVLHLAALLRRESDGWRFVDARPYTVAAIPS